MDEGGLGDVMGVRIPALIGMIKDDWRHWTLLPLRLVIGFGFAAHGWAKLSRGPEQFAVILTALHVPLPLVMAWTTSLVELLGGLAVMAGYCVLPLSVPLAAVMLTALFTVHLPYGFSSVRLKAVTAAGAEFGPVGYEMNLLYLAGLFALALDAGLKKKEPRS